jgi:hypothetical protein
MKPSQLVYVFAPHGYDNAADSCGYPIGPIDSFAPWIKEMYRDPYVVIDGQAVQVRKGYGQYYYFKYCPDQECAIQVWIRKGDSSVQILECDEEDD